MPPQGQLKSSQVVEDDKKHNINNVTAEMANGNDSTKKSVSGSILQQASSDALRPFVIISSSYLLFTVTDGAIRMIVLLHAYNMQFSALEVAIMFTLYELAGVFTNLAAGVLGSRWGIRTTLILGLLLQVFSYGLLFGWKDDWAKGTAIVYVTIAQMFAGIAKDLTKLGGKTVTKLVTPAEQDTRLFKIVSLITGWKNSLKGVGYFLGSALLQVSYQLALWFMIGVLLLALPWPILGLSNSLGKTRKENAKWSDVLSTKNRNLNILSLARLFLFASRDFWFEVPLPFFLRSPSCQGLGDPCLVDDQCPRNSFCDDVAADTLQQGMSSVCTNFNPGGGCGGLGLDRVVVGAVLGGYIILYGQVQSWTPQLVTGPLKQTPPNKLTEVLWGLINCIPTLVMSIVMAFSPAFQRQNEATDFNAMVAWFVVVIFSFAFIFAVNSSIHSFLVVNYAAEDKIAKAVGFYYMSNAAGRLFGTLGSGILYTYVGEDFGGPAGTNAVSGLAACFLAGTISSLAAALITMRIDDDKAGLQCGPCFTIIGDKEYNDDDGGSDCEHYEEPKALQKEETKEEETEAMIIDAAALARDDKMLGSTTEETKSEVEPRVTTLWTGLM